MTYQHSKHCNDGKRRSYWIFFLNGVEILRQKVPFDEHSERGFDHFVGLEDVYLYKGNIHQVRDVGWEGKQHWTGIKYKKRKVRFPISRKKLKELGVNYGDKILLSEK